MLAIQRPPWVFEWHLLDWVYSPTEWRVPASNNLYLIDTEQRTMLLAEGVLDEWHWKNLKILEALGWTVGLAPKTVGIGAGKSLPNFTKT